ncbi:hypothetical protein PR048_028640 [Dryococelus australis]|uniref:Uncharacterized protein n=1 Tax=Dryococelus australis TaxID=614101 RepID=A0ABQ9GB48_9NEOP|nr:hypothetical protein PR048_028640 [Dryococelus australis]
MKGPRWCGGQTTRLPSRRTRVRFPAGSSPNFRIWESCRTTLVGLFSRGSPVSPALAFRRCSILSPRFTVIGSQDLDLNPKVDGRREREKKLGGESTVTRRGCRCYGPPRYYMRRPVDFVHAIRKSNKGEGRSAASGTAWQAMSMTLARTDTPHTSSNTPLQSGRGHKLIRRFGNRPAFGPDLPDCFRLSACPEIGNPGKTRGTRSNSLLTTLESRLWRHRGRTQVLGRHERIQDFLGGGGGD